MSVMEWANAVLDLPSTSKPMPTRASDLPAPAATLAEAWCEALDSETSSQENQKVLLRALRVSRLAESHDLIISTVSPLLLSSSPSIRLQAAGTLLQYTSIAASTVLHARHLAIVKTIVRVLSPLCISIQSNSSPPSTSRFVSTCFRILSNIATKLSSLSTDVIDAIVSLLGHWVYYGPSIGGTASPAGRTSDPAQLSFGVMSSFSQNISPRKTRSMIAAAAKSTPTGERHAGSESESEEGTRDRRSESAQIRIDALTCLRSLATRNPRALQKHWHHFLSDSPYLRSRLTLMTLVESDPTQEVRLQACRALEALLRESTAYLAIAQDRPTKASFTSLSTKVGEIVGELHLSLTSLLDKPVAPGQSELRLAVLSLTRRLASCSPYGRMKRSLAGPLTRAVMTSAKHEEPTIVEATYSALSAVAKRYASTSSSQPVPWEEIIDAAELHVWEHPEQRIVVAILGFLAAAVPVLPRREWGRTLSMIGYSFGLTATPVQVARVKILAAFFLSPSGTPKPDQDLPPSSTVSGCIWSLLAALGSRNAPTRAAACPILAHPILNDYENVQPHRYLNELTRDRDPEVSAAARRVLGVTLRDPDNSNDQHREAVETLLEEFVLEEDGDICWALANACDGLTDKDAKRIDFETITDRAMTLMIMPRSDDTVKISCLRILGSMLKLMSKVFKGTDGVFEEVLSTFSEALEASSAKIRWNTCTSLHNAMASLSPVVLESSAFSSLFDQLSQILTTDPSYKVRIHAISVLMCSTTLAKTNAITSLDGEKAKDSARKAKMDLRDQLKTGKIKAAERHHVRVLLDKLDSLIAT
ncbi:hypothetical protein JCM16303_007179 [Sporobolomyces ruberrimus]